MLEKKEGQNKGVHKHAKAKKRALSVHEHKGDAYYVSEDKPKKEKAVESVTSGKNNS